jgi:uncharacterized integral membrane protein
MSEQAKEWSEAEEPGEGVDWYGVWQRVVLIGVLVMVAVLLVVGSQNYEERARVRFLLWSRETRLLTVFLSSIGLGIFLDEAVRRFRSVRRRQNALAASAAAADASAASASAASASAPGSPRRR